MQQELLLGQYYPADSWLHSLDPRSKLAGIFVLLTSFIAADNFRAVVILMLITGCLCGLSGIPGIVLVGNLRPMAWLLGITLLIPLVFTPGTPLLTLGPLLISREGLELGGLVTIRLAVILVLTSLLTLTTTPIELSNGLEGVLAPLQRVGVPVHELAVMMALALRFIPTLLEEAQKIINAQKARGARFGQGNIYTRTKAYLPVLIPLLISAFRRADQLGMAMEARCYRGALGRTRMKQLSWQRRDTLAVSVCLLVLLSIGFV